MSHIIDAVTHARAVRGRLRNPSNAVGDDGIDLKRKKQIKVIRLVPKTAPPEIKATLPLIVMGAPIPGYMVTYKQKGNVVPLPIPSMTDIIGNRPSLPIIFRTVASFYEKRLIDLVSDRRTADVVKPRQVAIYLARTLTKYSTPRIGLFCGGRDHTTVIHSFRKIESDIKFNERLADEIAVIKLHLSEMGFNCS